MEHDDAADAAVKLARPRFWQGASLTARVIDEASMVLEVDLFRAPAVSGERRGGRRSMLPDGGGGHAEIPIFG